MSNRERTTRPVQHFRRSPRPAMVLVLMAVLFILPACSVPFTGDDDSGETPAETEFAAPASTPTPAATPTPEPQVTVETDQAEWTIITGPEPEESPAERGDEQILRLTGPSDEPATIDPALVRDTSASFLARQVFRGLTRLDGNLDVVPDLARRIRISPDGRTYRFELHDTITFHDGSPITAADIKASLERAANPALTGGDGSSLPARGYLEDIQGATERMNGEREDIPGIVVVDDRTVEIALERGVVDFLERLASPAALIVDVDTAGIEGDWWRNANGSGPFILDQWDGQREIRLTPHDGYIRPPNLGAVEIRIGAEAVGEMQLYETDEIDVATVPLSAIDRVDYDGSPIEGNLHEVPLFSTTFVMINPGIEPFTDERLRQSLLHSFPRDDIPNIMLDGRAREAHGVLPPEVTDVDLPDFPYAYDPETAAQLASEIDLADNEPITIYTSGGGIPEALKYHIEEALALDVEVVQLRWRDYMEDLRGGEMPIFVLSWVADGPDPVSYVRALFHSESPENYIGFSDEQVDELLDQAAVEQDEDRRDELLLEAHRRILESAVVMPLYHSVEYTLAADHVRGLEITAMGILGLESVWIER